MKKTMFIKTLLAVLLSSVSSVASAQLVINEFMQSNIDCIMDDLNQFPDSWVELYNSGSESVNLNEYSISTGEEASSAWQLPEKVIAPGAYIVIYCDKEATGLHTDFRLDSGKGGAIYLFHNGKVVDKVTKIKKQPAPNIAYGRKENGTSEWGYMLEPTPGAANAGGITETILGEPVFSKKGRVVTNNASLQLTLSLPENAPEGCVIRYTIDGSEPTTQSTKYISSITIRKSTVVRAKLFCKGWLSPRSSVQSYIYHSRKQTLPVISIVTDNKYLTDRYIGIYVDGPQTDGQKNYEHDWRRPMNIELYETDGTTCGLNQLIEARIQGGQSRNWQLKSFALYANKRFGEKRLAYEFFPDQRPGQTNYKSILLRNAGNDFDYLYMRDAIIQRTMASHCDLDWQAWRPAIIYINGVYRGMLNIRERSNDDNIFTNYDELEDIDMIENWTELKNGTWDNYNAFKAFYSESGHTMAEYDQWMDTREFITIMAANLFYGNVDFPGNNIVLWRPRAEGGKWRFIFKDTDFGLGLYGRNVDYNTIKWIYDPNYDSSAAWANQPEHTLLFRSLMADPDFSREFIDRCAIFMGDFMNESGTREQWDPMYELIRTEYPYHRALINQWWPTYSDELRNAQNWVKNRPEKFYKHLADYYKLGSPVPLTVNKQTSADDLAGISILINGIPLSKGTFDGKFFRGRQVIFSSEGESENKVLGWTISETVSGKTTTQTIMQPVCQYVMPTATKVTVNAITTVNDGIQQISLDAVPQTHKLFRDNRIVIMHNGKEYNIDGTQTSRK